MPDEPSGASERAGEDRAELLRLASLGAPDGPSVDEALASFARLRAGPEEGRAVAALLALEGRRPLPDPLLLALAAALVDRGEERTAARVLARTTTPAALVLRADVLARAGDLAGAIALVERVLLRDFGWPGARERHARWRAELGLDPDAGRHAQPIASATLAASAPEAPFRLLREVGRGGAGTVYESEDRDLGRRVALKVYHRPDRDRAQLLHEARVAVTLAGPGIVRVFDVDPQNGWLAMEWARLGAVRSLLRERATALVPIGGWAMPLARSLARVHASGWVHNDVKPANVLLREPHFPLLSDLGTARRAGEPSPPGSLGYVSPERLGGRASDPLDDIYGFGRILEDAVGILGIPGGEDDARRWTELASACTSADDERSRAFAALLKGGAERRQRE
jgi:serine/threonine-protein kinase